MVVYPQWWVWKFGGSSVANYDAIDQVCGLISDQFTNWANQQLEHKSEGALSTVPGVAPNHLTVVVSAVKGVTNLLESALNHARGALEKISQESSMARRNCFLVDIRATLMKFREAEVFSAQLEAASLSHYFGPCLLRIAEIHMEILEAIRSTKRTHDANEFSTSFFKDLTDVACVLQGVTCSGTCTVAQSSFVLGMGEHWSVQLVKLIITPRIQALNAKRSHAGLPQPFVISSVVLNTRHVLTLKESQKKSDIRQKLRQQHSSGASNSNLGDSSTVAMTGAACSSCGSMTAKFPFQGHSLQAGPSGHFSKCDSALRLPENESSSFLPNVARSHIVNGDHTLQQWLSPKNMDRGGPTSSQLSEHDGTEEYSIGPRLISASSREVSQSPSPIYPPLSPNLKAAAGQGLLSASPPATSGDIKLCDSTLADCGSSIDSPMAASPKAPLDRTPTRGGLGTASGEVGESGLVPAGGVPCSYETWAFPSLRRLDPHLFPAVGPTEFAHPVTGSVHRLPRLDWKTSYRNLAAWFAADSKKLGTRTARGTNSFRNPSVELEFPATTGSLLLPPTANLILATGFVCQTLDGQPATLQRNGSDTSAVILAALLRAKGVTIWSDVSGILTGDPRYCRNAQHIEYLSYEEALELAGIGARVLHPASLLPSMHMKLPMLLKSTFQPELPGTTIADFFDLADSATFGKVVTKISDVCLFTLSNFPLTSLQNFASRLFAAIEKGGGLPLFITQGLSCSAITTAVAGSETDAVFHAIVEEFRHDSQDYGSHLKLAVDSECSILSVVGRGQRNYVGALAAWSTALSNRRVNVKAISQSSSELSTSFVVARSSEAEAIDALHEVILRPRQPAVPENQAPENQAPVALPTTADPPSVGAFIASASASMETAATAQSVGIAGVQHGQWGPTALPLQP